MTALQRLFESFRQALPEAVAAPERPAPAPERPAPAPERSVLGPPAPAAAPQQPQYVPPARSWAAPAPSPGGEDLLLLRNPESVPPILQRRGPEPPQIGPTRWERLRDLYGEEFATSRDPEGKERTERAEEQRALRTFKEPREPTPLPGGLRDSVLRGVYELTHEDYAALAPEQRAAVEFNTALVDAAQLDDETGTTDATDALLQRLGIEVKDDREIDEFLQLDRTISESILAKLGDPNARTDMASTMRWARGDIDAAGDARRMSEALNIVDPVMEALGEQLANTGTNRLVGDGEAAPGWQNSQHDQVIQQIYTDMVDSSYTMTSEQVAEGIAKLNELAGTDVTPEQVWQFLRTNLDAAQLAEQQGGTARLAVPELHPLTGEPFVPLDIAEIRRRYGL